MFDKESRPTTVKSVVESADSGVESADSTSNPLRIGLWVGDFSLQVEMCTCIYRNRTCAFNYSG